MANANERLGLEEMREALRSPVQGALGSDSSEHRIEYLCDPKEVADDPAKLLILDGKGRKQAVVLVASPVEPDLVGRGMRIAAEARDAVGGRLGRVILEPLGEGTIDGLSYTILPYRNPIPEGRIARRLTRRALRRPILDWLSETSQATARDVDGAERVSAFEEPLRHMTTSEIVDEPLRMAANEALLGLERGDWKPTSVLMHGDLWEGNVLLTSSWLRTAGGSLESPFVLIDWPGAQLRGYPFYDLLRIVRSMRFGPATLEREVARHRATLGTDPAGAMGHLLACLGHTGLNLECFPVEMYAEVCRACFRDLRNALGPNRG